MGAGAELAATIGVATAGGYGLDGWLKTGPWLTVLGAVAGTAIAFYRLIKLSRIKPSRR